LANTNLLFGFLAIGRWGGGPISAQQYSKGTAHTQAIFVGDILAKAATSLAASDAGLPVPGCTSLQNGTPGTTLWLGSSIDYGAAATNTYHWVFDTPDTIFIGQSSDNTSMTNANHAGKLVPFTTGSGNATTLKSTMGFTGASAARAPPAWTRKSSGSQPGGQRRGRVRGVRGLHHEALLRPGCGGSLRGKHGY